jgi:hypothetical protein
MLSYKTLRHFKTTAKFPQGMETLIQELSTCHKVFAISLQKPEGDTSLPLPGPQFDYLLCIFAFLVHEMCVYVADRVYLYACPHI